MGKLASWRSGVQDTSATDIRLMRGWLEDCDYEGQTGSPVCDLEDVEVLDMVEWNYQGGIDQFMLDGD